MIYIMGTVFSLICAYGFMHSIQYRGRFRCSSYYKCNTNIVPIILISFTPLFLLSAFRDNIGTDFKTYVRIFNDIKADQLQDDIEVGYILLNKLCLVITEQPQSIFIVTSFFFCLFTYLSIYEQSDNICFSIILFLLLSNYYISLNVVRQFMASSICVYAFKYIYNRNLLKYVICVLLASSIHAVSFIFLVIYFLPCFKIKKIGCFCFLTIFIACSPFYKIILEKILVDTKYYPLLTNYPVSGLMFFIYMVGLNVLLLLLLLRGYKTAGNSVKFNLFLNLQLLAVAFSCLLRSIPQIERVVWMMSFVQYISVPYALKFIKLRRNRVLITSLLIGILVFFFSLNFMVYKNHAVWPYKSIFS